MEDSLKRNGTNLLSELKSDPKKFVAEVSNLNPDDIKHIVSLLEALLEQSEDRETELDTDLSNKNTALADADTAVTEAKKVLAAEELEVTAAKADVAAKETAHGERLTEKETSQQNHDDEVPGLNDEQKVLRDVIDLLMGLHSKHKGGGGPYKFWRWNTIKEGTHAHICIDRLRLVHEDGTYGVPIKVTFPQGTNLYATNGYPFNIKGWGGPNNDHPNHWCAWSLAIIDMEFETEEKFVSYKFETHASACTNDPQEWNLEGSDDGVSWAVVNHQEHDCHSDPIKRTGYNEYTI